MLAAHSKRKGGPQVHRLWVTWAPCEHSAWHLAGDCEFCILFPPPGLKYIICKRFAPLLGMPLSKCVGQGAAAIEKKKCVARKHKCLIYNQLEFAVRSRNESTLKLLVPGKWVSNFKNCIFTPAVIVWFTLAWFILWWGALFSSIYNKRRDLFTESELCRWNVCYPPVILACLKKGSAMTSHTARRQEAV